MEKHFQIRPYLSQVVFPALLQNSFDQDEHPRRNPRDAVDIFPPGTFHNRFDLAFPFVHQNDFFFGYPDQINQRIQVL